MPSLGYIFAAVLIAAGITFALRLLPFGLKSLLRNSAVMHHLAAWIPLGAMLLLAAYVFFEIDYSSVETATPYLAGAAGTIVMQLWRKNMVLSMVVGTGICVVLANWVFA